MFTHTALCVCVYIPSDSHYSTCQYMIIWTNEFIFSPYLPSAQTHYEPLLLSWSTCVFPPHPWESLLPHKACCQAVMRWWMGESLWLLCEFIHVKAALGIHISTQRGLCLESRWQSTAHLSAQVHERPDVMHTDAFENCEMLMFAFWYKYIVTNWTPNRSAFLTLCLFKRGHF